MAREEFPHISFEDAHCSDADSFPELESVEQLDARCEEFLRLVRRLQKGSFTCEVRYGWGRVVTSNAFDRNTGSSKKGCLVE